MRQYDKWLQNGLFIFLFRISYYLPYIFLYKHSDIYLMNIKNLLKIIHILNLEQDIQKSAHNL